MRSKIGLLGERRPFRAVRHFSQKWATCTPRAEHAPEGLVNPAVAWGTLGLHVVNAKGARGALEWGAVSVVVSRDLFSRMDTSNREGASAS